MDCPVCHRQYDDTARLEAHVNAHFSDEPERRREPDAEEAAPKRAKIDGTLSKWIATAAPPRIATPTASFLRDLAAELGAAGLKARLCHPSIIHYGASKVDAQWGCGYRNTQMLLSALRGIGGEYTSKVSDRAMDIADLQRSIESAWSRGFDTEGAEQLNHRVVGTTKWVGATDLCAMLRSMGIRANLLDSPTPGAHMAVFSFLRDYFQSAAALKDEKTDKNIVFCDIPPVYFQYQGHSRSVVGICGDSLVVLDPGIPATLTAGGKGAKKPYQRFLWPAAGLVHPQYQLLVVKGVYGESIPEEAKILTSERLS